jgi:phosphoglycolate phosphatase
MRTILLDLDGTLTDPKEGITRCIQHAMNMLGHDAPDADSLTWCIGPPLKNSFSRLLQTSDENMLGKALSHYRDRYGDVGMYENTIYPDIPDALHSIRNTGVKLMLATSKPEIYARKILEFMNIIKYFDSVYGSSLDGHLSDKTHLVGHIAASENLVPAQTMIAGDRKHDIIGGRANGIMTAAVTWGYGTLKELQDEKPDFIVDTPGELVSLIEKSI